MNQYNFKRLAYFPILFAVILLSSCKKDYQLSKKTFLPIITLKGNSAVAINLDGTFTDPGASANVNGNPIDYVTSGTVNSSESGVYTITYTATNEDGFSSSVTRDVLVLPGEVTNDVDYIAGDYSTPGGTTPATTFATISKIAPGAYYTTNCWGNGSLAILPAYFFCLDGVSLTIPKFGEGAAQVETLDGPGTYDVPSSTITWIVTRPLFSGGPLVRTKNWTKI